MVLDLITLSFDENEILRKSLNIYLEVNGNNTPQRTNIITNFFKRCVNLKKRKKQFK